MYQIISNAVWGSKYHLGLKAVIDLSSQTLSSLEMVAVKGDLIPEGNDPIIIHYGEKILIEFDEKHILTVWEMAFKKLPGATNPSLKKETLELLVETKDGNWEKTDISQPAKRQYAMKGTHTRDPMALAVAVHRQNT